MDEHTSAFFKHIVDGVSVLAVVGTLYEQLPRIAALFTLIWTILRIYEMVFVHRIFSKGQKNVEDA